MNPSETVCLHYPASLGIKPLCPYAALLASDAGLAAKLEGTAAPDNGFLAVARLTWGLLLSTPKTPEATLDAEVAGEAFEV